MGLDARLLVEPRFMKSERFGLGPIPKEPIVTIAKVKQQKEQGSGGEDETWGMLYFKESWARPLKIITTHMRCLLAMFNPEGNYDSDLWLNKRVQLYAMPGTFFGKRGTAVRFRGSPDLKEPISVSIKKFGGGSDVYDLKPTGQPQPPTPYERMWGAWKAAGRDEKDGKAFKALVVSSTGAPSNTTLTDGDVAKFTAALNGPPPPMSEGDQAAAEAAEQAQAGSTS